MDHLITGGFYSILDRPLTLEFIADLLWFGLKWDNPDLTALDTRKILLDTIKQKYTIWNRIGRYFTKQDDSPVLLNLLMLCKSELFLSGWFAVPEKLTFVNPVTADTDVKEPTGEDIILLLEHQMFYCGYPGDPWQLTPNEIYQYIKAHNERIEQEREQQNFNAANICASVFNARRTSRQDPVTKWQDFMPRKDSGDSQQTAQDQQNLIMQLNAIYGGQVG